MDEKIERPESASDPFIIKQDEEKEFDKGNEETKNAIFMNPFAGKPMLTLHEVHLLMSQLSGALLIHGHRDERGQEKYKKYL